MLHDNNENEEDFLEVFKNETDDDSGGNDGGFTQAVLELTKKVNKDNLERQ